MTDFLHQSLPLVIDVILAACLFIGTMFGMKKGLIKGVVSIAVLVVSLVVAGLVAKALTPSVTAWVEPKIETRMIEKITKGVFHADYTVMDSLKDRMEEWNIGTDFMDKLEDSVGKTVENAATGAVKAAMGNLAGTIVYVILFGITFTVANLLLGVLVNALDIFSKLPVVNFANRVGGAALGLVKSALLIYVVVWFMYHLHIVLTKDIVESSTVLKFFATVNPLELLLKQFK